MTLMKLFLKHMKKQAGEAVSIIYLSMLVGIGLVTGVGLILSLLGVK